MSDKNTVRYAAEGKTFIRSMTDAQSNSDPEKAVESAVNQMLHGYLSKKYHSENVLQSYPHNTDGLITVGAGLFSDTGTRSVLVESKKNLDFSNNKSHIAQVLVQVIYYFHAFQQAGDHLPDAVVIADEDEIMVVNGALLTPYLREDHDWSYAPSTAWRQNTELFCAVRDNKNIRSHVFNVFSEAFDTKTFCELVISAMNNSTPEKITITKDNLDKHFLEFTTQVFPRGVQDVSNQKQIDIFMQSLKGSEEIFVHPKRAHTLSVSGKNITGVNAVNYETFWDLYDSNNYSHTEVKSLTEICDTLIEETDRRFTGDFWTPKIWVDRAHEMIAGDLGEDWKNERVVWCPAAGSKNLTRDHRFGRLYCSTLHTEELSLSADYNTEGTAFQYDFLNDDIEMLTMTREQIAADPGRWKMPEDLVQDLLDKKPFVFFDNPPYGSNGNGTKSDDRKGGIALTAVSELMGKGMGHARQELYTQFIWRVMKMKEIFDYDDSDQMDFFFFNKGFLTSPNFSVFTKKLTSEFTCEGGFMLNAGEFSGTSSAWGILFSHWSHGGSDQKTLKFDVLQSTKDLDVEKIGDWTATLVDKGETISDWLAEIPVSKTKCETFPLTKNGLDIPTASSVLCTPRKGWIGYLHNHGNNVQFSDKYTGLYSMGFAGAHGRDITENNLTRAMTTFSIRRAVQEKIAADKQLWIRDKDIFTTPTASLLTDEFTADCMVYSLCDRQSKQTSLRNYVWRGTSHRVVNQFYPFSREETIAWAVEAKNMPIQVDASTDTDRIMYDWLTTHDTDLSSEARTLLDTMKELYKDSMIHRDLFAQTSSRYQSNSWDAGWMQIQRMIFGTDRITDALLDKRGAFTTARAALASKIANAAISDGVI